MVFNYKNFLILWLVGMASSSFIFLPLILVFGMPWWGWFGLIAVCAGLFEESWSKDEL